MSGVLAWCWWAWLQIWPNLAASAIWAPAAFAVHHVVIRRHVARATTTTLPPPGARQDLADVGPTLYASHGELSGGPHAEERST